MHANCALIFAPVISRPFWTRDSRECDNVDVNRGRVGEQHKQLLRELSEERVAALQRIN